MSTYCAFVPRAVQLGRGIMRDAHPGLIVHGRQADRSFQPALTLRRWAVADGSHAPTHAEPEVGTMGASGSTAPPRAPGNSKPPPLEFVTGDLRASLTPKACNSYDDPVHIRVHIHAAHLESPDRRPRAAGGQTPAGASCAAG
jgi:hypothetical protein